LKENHLKRRDAVKDEPEPACDKFRALSKSLKEKQ